MPKFRSTFVDPRDGSTYQTVRLRDGRRWFAENLRFVTYDANPGTYPRLDVSFPADPRLPEQVLARYPSYDSATYGRLYTWLAAQRAAPPGWHVPTAHEWKRLFNHYGGWAPDIHASEPSNNDISSLVKDMNVHFGGCLRASDGASELIRALEMLNRQGIAADTALSGEHYTYFGGFVGARFWSSSRPTLLSGFDARKFSGIYFLIRPNSLMQGNAVATSNHTIDASAHRSEEVLDYAFSVRCIAD